MSDTAFAPWEQYPHIWKTESAFWTTMRGQIRKAVWMRNPIKITFKNKNTFPVPKGMETRAKSGACCSLCGEWFAKSHLEVDHIKGNIPLRDVDDILQFILHMYPEESDLQLACKPCHKIKSYAERKNIPFEEARIEKEVITIMKEKLDKQREMLLNYGYSEEDMSNATKRRNCFRQALSQLKEKL